MTEETLLDVLKDIRLCLTITLGIIAGLTVSYAIGNAFGQVDYNREYFNATITLKGEIEQGQELTLVTGPGTCKSYVMGDPPAQYLVGEVLNDTIDIANFNRTYYYEPGALIAGEKFFVHISVNRNDTTFACTQTINGFGPQQEHITAILPSEVTQNVWKHDNEFDGHETRVDSDYKETKGHIYLLYNPDEGMTPRKFQ